MGGWQRSEVLSRLGSLPRPRVVFVRGTLNSLALITLTQDLEDTYVVYVDAWIDFPWVRHYLFERLSRLERGRVVTPKPPYLFWEYIFKRGYPFPHRMFRWHTRRVRIEPLHRFAHSVGARVLILDSTLFDLPDDKRFRASLTVRDGVGTTVQGDFKLVFPLALATPSDVNVLALESHDPYIYGVLRLAPRGDCFLCLDDAYLSHAEVALSRAFFGAYELYKFLLFIRKGVENPANREIDEHGYPRSLSEEFRLLVYSRYQSLASYLNMRFPGYLPLLPSRDDLFH